MTRVSFKMVSYKKYVHICVSVYLLVRTFSKWKKQSVNEVTAKSTLVFSQNFSWIFIISFCKHQVSNDNMVKPSIPAINHLNLSLSTKN